MVIQLILNIFMGIGTLLLSTIGGLMPQQDLATNIGSAVTLLLSTTHQALNFLYFIFGDTMFVVLPVSIVMLGLKYTIIPLIVIFRSFFINSNN